jgi:hypothetical protein
MHPWMIERLAQERHHEMVQAASRARASHHPRGAGSAGAGVVNRRATRYLGELLIRTGWRLVGPEAPGSGIRSRLAFGGSTSAMVESG